MLFKKKQDKEMMKDTFILGISVQELQRQVEEKDKMIALLEKRTEELGTRLAWLSALCGDMSIDDTIAMAHSLAFYLRIMKKQLSDQLIYLGGGDTSVVTTMRYDNIDQLCKFFLGSIEVVLQTAENMKKE